MNAAAPTTRNANAIHELMSVPTTQLTMKATNETNAAVRQTATLFVIVVAAAACLIAGFHARTWWYEFTSPQAT